MNADQRILIVADDESFATHLKACLMMMGYTVTAVVSDWREDEGIAGDVRPDLALVDLGIRGDVTGPAAGKRLCQRFDVPVVYMTDDVDGDMIEQAQTTKPYGYLLKPVDARQLHLSIQAAVSIHNWELEFLKAQNRLERKIDGYKNRADLMETVFNSMSEGVVAIDKDGATLFHNSRGPRIGGCHPLENDIASWPERYGVFLPDGQTVLSEDLNPLMLALRGQATEETEFLVRNELKPDGVHVNISARPLLDRSGSPSGGVAVFRDVTKLKQAEAELERTFAKLQEQAELMETILKSMSDGIIVADTSGKFLYVNPGATQIVGMEIKEGFPDSCAEKYGVYFPDRITPMKTENLPLMRAIRLGESTDEEDAYVRNDNKKEGVYIRMSARPLLDNLGGIRGGVVIFRDVTERVLAEEALARAFDQGRLEMVDTILHNIGNAMNSVTTGIETVRRNLSNDRAGRRLFALASAIDAHRSDWIDYISNDPAGPKGHAVHHQAGGRLRQTERRVDENGFPRSRPRQSHRGHHPHPESA